MRGVELDTLDATRTSTTRHQPQASGPRFLPERRAAVLGAEIVHLPLPAERQRPRLVDVGTTHRVPHERYPLCGRNLRSAPGTLDDTAEKLPDQPHQQHHDEKPDEPGKHHESATRARSASWWPVGATCQAPSGRGIPRERRWASSSAGSHTAGMLPRHVRPAARRAQESEGQLGLCRTDVFDQVGGGERFGAARGDPLYLFPGLDGALEILFPGGPDDADVQERLGVRRGHFQ